MTDPHHTDPALLLRCLENTLERFRRSARATDGRLLVESDGLLLIAAEGLPWITGATLTRVPRDPTATLARAQAFFAECALSWRLTAAGEAATAIAPVAEAAGLVPGERLPGMLLAPLAGEPHEVPGLEIREVRDPQALAVFNATSAAGFGGEDLFPLIYQPAVLETPDVALYVGYLHGEPVATAVRGTSYRIAGIGGVSTIPAARRRGIGEAITWRAALDGRAEGCIASFLQATEMGYGLYARMGYRHVIDFHTWEAPAGYSRSRGEAMTEIASGQSGIAEVNGARLFYEVAGAGRTVVLLHAGIADSRMWDEQFEELARSFRVIRYDARGYGRSDMPAGPFSRHEDLYGLLRYLDVERASLVGLSMGGSTVIDFTLAHPEMVEALVPVAPGLSGYQYSDAMKRADEEEDAAFERGDMEAVFEINLRTWVDGPARSPDAVDPAVREKVRQMQRDASTSTEGQPQRLDPPAAGRLGEIVAPTLVIVGDADMPDMLAIADLLATGIAGARKVILPGVAHMVNMERPAEFNRLVLEFLQRVQSTE